MSTRNDFSQVSAESPTASALTLQTSASMPPSAAALADTHAASAGPSATSSARPKAWTPVAFSAATVASTSSALRAQTETLAPSAAKASATARPMPLVPPVTRARLPLSPRSMSVLLACCGGCAWRGPVCGFGRPLSRLGCSDSPDGHSGLGRPRCQWVARRNAIPERTRCLSAEGPLQPPRFRFLASRLLGAACSGDFRQQRPVSSRKARAVAATA